MGDKIIIPKYEFDAGIQDGTITDAYVIDDSRWPHNVPYQPNKYAHGMRDGKRVAACIRGPKCIDEPPARENDHDN